MRKLVRITAAVLLALGAGACSDVNKQESPITLVVSTAQTLHHIDIMPGAANCGGGLGQVNIEPVLVQTPNTGNNVAPPQGFNPPTTPTPLNQVNITRYQVTWQRLDGGHLIPGPMVRSTSMSLTVGSSGAVTQLVVFTPDMLNQAPFAALYPQNGGVDPETGKTTITVDAIITFFGQTLAGENVSGTTRMTLDFCYSCGGCA